MQDVLPHVPFVSCPQKHLLKGDEVCVTVCILHMYISMHILYIPRRLFVSKSIVLPPLHVSLGVQS